MNFVYTLLKQLCAGLSKNCVDYSENVEQIHRYTHKGSYMQKMRIDPKTIQPKCVFCILYIFEGFCYYILYIDPTSPPALPDIPVCLQTNINLDT